MKRFLNRLQIENDFAMAGKMFLIFLLIVFVRISHHYFFGLVAFVIFYTLLSKDFLLKSRFWFLVSLAIIPGIWDKFNFTANHFFLVLYMAVLFMIATYFSKFRSQVAAINAKAILGIIMFFSVLQKLLSENFMNGSVLVFLNLKGGFFTHFQRFFPDNEEIIAENLNRIQEQASTVESLSKSIELTPVNWIVEFDTSVLVPVILATEALFLLLLFVKNQYIRNGFFSLFVIALIFTRYETGFASLLCILLFMQAHKDRLIFRLIYIGIFSIFVSITLSKLGLF